MSFLIFPPLIMAKLLYVIYKVEDEQSVEKYEAMVVDALLKKLLQGSRN